VSERGNGRGDGRGAGHVRLTAGDDVLWALIDGPRTRNAISLAVIAGLETMLAAAGQLRPKVLVIRGAEGTFSSGADLRELRELIDDGKGLRSFMARFGAVLRELERAPWVTVAVVEGFALAGGCELLLSCDIVIAACDARIGDGHVEFGLVPAAGGSVRLPRAIPAAFARYLLLTGDTISGAEAERKGLAAIAVEPDELDAEVDRIVSRLRSRGRATLQAVKAMLAADRDGANQRGLDRELDLFLKHAAGAGDVRAGLDAFHARRHGPP
jgi:enoyl-CoA hydratase